MNEVEVIYLDDKGQYKERKYKHYKGMDNALKVFRETYLKLMSQGTKCLIILRKYENNRWVMIKNERV